VPRQPPADRPRLTREKVLEGAVAVADEQGLSALTMRSLATQLGVKPMSLYHHVPNKDAILDGIVDAVFAEVELPEPDEAWRPAMERRAHSAREVLGRHPWATALLDSRREAGPATLRHHDAVLGALRRGGFSVPMAAHAFAVIDAYVYGFALTEAALPFDGPDETVEVTEHLLAEAEAAALELPHLTELATQHVLQPGYAYGDEFAYGLELILDGLARRVA
jgi:AcrR family transcriptional regulator